jgi:hypothetical protein
MTNEDEQAQQRAEAFEALREFDQKLEPYFKQQIADRRAVVERLEARFADRGLSFTLPFGGDYPVQAFGHLDGMRFYFRYRWGGASIKMGPYDREIEELHSLRGHEGRLEHLAKDRARFEAGEISEQDYRFSQIMAEKADPVAKESDPDYYPHRTAAHASLRDPADNSLKGDLTSEECEQFFAQLIENLIPVPEDQQLSDYDRILYYEGWEAARAWYDKRQDELIAQQEILRETYG